MKNKKEEFSKFEIKFWKDWLNADLLKREEMVSNLPIIKEILNIKELPEKFRKQALTNVLNGLFEDLRDAVYIKIERDKKK